MNVLHVAASQALTWGGPVSVLRTLSSTLVRRGVGVTVVSAAGGRSGIPGDFGSGIRGITAPTTPLARLWPGHAPGLRRMMDGLVRDSDVVHIHEPWHYPGFLAYRAARRAERPFVVSVHNSFSPWHLSHKRGRKMAFMALFQRRILERARFVHALTEKEAEQVRRLAPRSRVVVVPNGLRLDQFDAAPPRRESRRRLGLAPEDLAVLFLGRLHEVKGVDILLRACARLREEGLPVRPVIAGPDSGFGSRARALAAELGLDDLTLWPGAVDGEERLDAFNAADAFALPSHSEGFSMTILEAMAMRLPVVITPGCSLPQVADADAGFVVEREPGAVADALRTLLGDASLRARMGANGRGLVERHFGADVIAADFERIYRDALGGSGDR